VTFGFDLVCVGGGEDEAGAEEREGRVWRVIALNVSLETMLKMNKSITKSK